MWGQIVSGSDLRCANRTRAKLQHATVRGALVTDGNLTRANVSSAHLDGGNLPRVDLSFATLTDADLTDADLSGANLSYVALNGADLSGALWPLAEAVPWGWQPDTDSGRLKRARLSARFPRPSRTTGKSIFPHPPPGAPIPREPPPHRTATPHRPTQKNSPRL